MKKPREADASRAQGAGCLSGGEGARGAPGAPREGIRASLWSQGRKRKASAGRAGSKRGLQLPSMCRYEGEVQLQALWPCRSSLEPIEGGHWAGGNSSHGPCSLIEAPSGPGLEIPPQSSDTVGWETRERLASQWGTVGRSAHASPRGDGLLRLHPQRWEEADREPPFSGAPAHPASPHISTGTPGSVKVHSGIRVLGPAPWCSG